MTGWYTSGFCSNTNCPGSYARQACTATLSVNCRDSSKQVIILPSAPFQTSHPSTSAIHTPHASNAFILPRCYYCFGACLSVHNVNEYSRNAKQHVTVVKQVTWSEHGDTPEYQVSTFALDAMIEKWVEALCIELMWIHQLELNEAFAYFFLLVRMVQILTMGARCRLIMISVSKLFALVVSEWNQERGGD